MGTVYFWTPDVNHASGGIRAVYRLVDACNSAGVGSAVMHQNRGFRATWFEHSTRIVSARDVRVAGTDVLVISELDAPRMLHVAPGVTKVILNQHQYWTFVGGPVDYRHQDVAQVITVSDDGVRYLARAFPGLATARLRCAVDTSLFQPEEGRRDKSIVFLEAKGGMPRLQVLAMVKSNDLARGWTVEALSGLSQEEMASRLATAAVFASFSEFEGFQMLLTEAMASGCAVVGFTAGGGAEYLTDDVAWPVPAGDIVGFVDRLEEVLSLWETGRDVISRKTQSAIELVRQRYTLENEAGDIVAALQPALEQARRCPITSTFDVHYREHPLRAAARRLYGAARAFKYG